MSLAQDGVWKGGVWAPTAWADGVWAESSDPAGAIVSGTAATGLSQSSVINGGETVVISLQNATWAASGSTFNAQRQNIINGMTASVTTTNGWNNEVRDNLAVTAVARTSDTQVTITLSAQAGLSITSNEIITITVPATATSESGALVASPSFTLSSTDSVGGEGPFSGEDEWFSYRRRQWAAMRNLRKTT